MPFVVAVAALLVGSVLLDVVRRPSLRRLAFRNINRRRGEALLIVTGSLLGTAIITAAFVVDDTIESSIRDFGRTRLGPIDQTVTVSDPGRLDAIERALGGAPIPDVDGVLRAVTWPASIASVAEDRRVEPDGGVLEIDVEAARSFGGAPRSTGLDGVETAPRPGEAIINDRLARKLRVGSGDLVEVFAYGSSIVLDVRAVVPEVGLAGYRSMIVAPGTVAELTGRGSAPGARPPQGQILVSNEGGVFDSAESTPAVVAALRDRLAAAGSADGVEIQPVKQDLLDNAAEQGRAVGQLYQGIGSFSVIAGVLLLVNLFVMLADERKVELGMLRAVGFKRNHVARSFAIEGAVYSAAAAAIGAFLGIGVGWIITQVAQRIIAAEDPDLVFRLDVRDGTLVRGFLLGLVIAMVTVWATSARISRMNVISAIRNLAEPRHTGPKRRALAFAATGLVAGVALSVLGIAGAAALPALVGPPTAVASLAALARRRLSARAVNAAASVAAMLWAIGVFVVLPGAMKGSTIELFVVQGVILVGAAVTLVTTLDTAAAHLVRRVLRSGGGLPARLGLAYPIARRFRSGMLLGMYALIIFTMTFISVLSGVVGGQAGDFTEAERSGFDVFVDSNPSNPLSVEALRGHPGVVAAAPVVRASADWTARFQAKPAPFPVAGFDERLLAVGTPGLSSRDARFADDEQVFRALLADPSLAVVNDYFLQGGGGPPADVVEVGDTVTMIDPVSRRAYPLTVVGVLTSDAALNGAYLSGDFVRSSLGDRAVETRHYVAVAPGQDAEAVARGLTDRFLDRGADARTFRSEVDAALSQFQSFLALMRAYLALGLLVGIAGLGVVMVRAVRERRREIGMLRALGVSGSSIRRAFLLEAGFIALQGVAIGMLLGLVTSWSVLVNSTVFSGSTPAFRVPPIALVVIVVVPLTASLLATLAPAAQASRIQPAVALRIAE